MNCSQSLLGNKATPVQLKRNQSKAIFVLRRLTKPSPTPKLTWQIPQGQHGAPYCGLILSSVSAQYLRPLPLQLLPEAGSYAPQQQHFCCCCWSTIGWFSGVGMYINHSAVVRCNLELFLSYPIMCSPLKSPDIVSVRARNCAFRCHECTRVFCKGLVL